MEKVQCVTLIVFVSLVMDLIAFTMILPLLPSLLDYYSSQDDPVYSLLHQAVTNFRLVLDIPDTARWNSVLFGGIIGSLFSFLQYLASPLTGALSDVYGRKPILLIALIVSLISYILFALSSSFTLFLVARIVGGLSKGNTGLCISIMTDVTDTNTRGRAMALVGIAYSLGFLVGPLLGAGFARLIRLHPEMFFQAPAIAGAIITGLEIVFVIGFLTETLPEYKRMPSIGQSLNDIVGYVSPTSLFTFNKINLTPPGLRSLRTIGVVYFLFIFLFSGVEFTLTFLVHDRFNYDSMQQGKMFFFMGIVMAAVQGGYVRRLKPGSQVRTARLGIVCLMSSYLIISLARTTTIFYSGLVLFCIGSASVVPCLTTLASQHGTEDQKGTVLGIFRSLGALARAAGPIAACSWYWYFGPVKCYLSAMVALILPLGLLRSNVGKQTTD